MKGAAMVRKTIKNPDGKTYRMPLVNSKDEFRVDMSMGYPTIFGTIVNLIGRLEDIKPIEEWLETAKK